MFFNFNRIRSTQTQCFSTLNPFAALAPFQAVELAPMSIPFWSATYCASIVTFPEKAYRPYLPTVAYGEAYGGMGGSAPDLDDPSSFQKTPFFFDFSYTWVLVVV